MRGPRNQVSPLWPYEKYERSPMIDSSLINAFWLTLFEAGDSSLSPSKNMTKYVSFPTSNLVKKPQQNNLENLITAVSYQEKAQIIWLTLEKDKDRNWPELWWQSKGKMAIDDYVASLECVRSKDCRGLSEGPVPREYSSGVIFRSCLWEWTRNKKDPLQKVVRWNGLSAQRQTVSLMTQGTSEGTFPPQGSSK